MFSRCCDHRSGNLCQISISVIPKTINNFTFNTNTRNEQNWHNTKCNKFTLLAFRRKSVCREDGIILLKINNKVKLFNHHLENLARAKCLAVLNALQLFCPMAALMHLMSHCNVEICLDKLIVIFRPLARLLLPSLEINRIWLITHINISIYLLDTQSKKENTDAFSAFPLRRKASVFYSTDCVSVEKEDKTTKTIGLEMVILKLLLPESHLS